MSEAAWNKAFTQGSRALQDRLKKVHANNPKFQAWLQASGHGTETSVKQASKEVKPSARVRKLQTASLKAYGATKGAKVGGEHGSEEMKDTIVPLTRDQHSKVQAAERAAKAAAKAAAPAKPKKPLSKAERMAVIARAATRAKSKDRFDVPTVNPDDMDHDDLRDVHNQMHIRGTYSEATDRIALIKAMASKNKMNKPVKLKKKPDSVKKIIDRHKYVSFIDDVTGYTAKAKQKGINRFEEVEQIDELDQKTLKSYIKKNVNSKAYEKSPNRDAGLERATAKVARNLATSTLKNKVSNLKYTSMAKHKNPFEYQVSRDELANRNVSEEVEQIDELKVKTYTDYISATYGDSPAAQARKLGGPKNPQRNLGRYRAKRLRQKQIDTPEYQQMLAKSRPQDPTSGADRGYGQGRYMGDNVNLEGSVMNEVTKKEAEATFGGPVKEKPKMPPGKQPAGYRYVRGLARKAMKKGMKEEVDIKEEIKDAADVGEYDYEGDMAKSQLRSIMANAKRMHDMLEENTNLPEWVQSKITLAEDYVVTAANYMEGEMNEEVEQVDEVKAVKAYDKEGKLVGRYRSMDHAKQMKPGHTYKVEEEKKPDASMAMTNQLKMKEAMDPVGKEDKDIDNDGDSDKTDVYLSKKRAAIGKSIKDKLAKKLGK